MDDSYHIANLRDQQPCQSVQPRLFTQAKEQLPVDYQALFWLYAAIVERAELSSPNVLNISIPELAINTRLSIEETQQGIHFLKENGYLENLRLYLKNHFYCRIKKSKIQRLRFHEQKS